MVAFFLDTVYLC